MSALGLGLGGLGLKPVLPRGPSSPVPYHADAVHFDGATWLSIASLATSGIPSNFSWAGWINLATIPAFAPLFIADIENSGAPNFILQDASPQLQGQVVSAADDAFLSVGSDITAAAWHLLVYSSDTLAGQFKLYMDRVDVTSVIANDTPFTALDLNGLSFLFGGDGVGDNLTADVADVRIAPGQSWLTDGDIAPATLDLFSTALNKPVDPAVATAALGAPCMLFSGDASTFATNQGTGGSFTLTGTLTNATSS